MNVDVSRCRSANLVVLLGDEHRRDALGCAGNPEVHTPNIDRLARDGIWFNRAYANTPVCTPSRGSLLTGTWPSRHRAMANDFPVDPAAPSIAQALNGAGYECGYVGKWHLGGVPRNRFVPPGPERLGFDALWASWNCHHTYFHPRWHEDDPTPIEIEGRYEPELQTDRALAWLRNRAGGDSQPFCLFVSYGPPHNPYRPLPPGMEGRYDGGSLSLRGNCPGEISPAALERMRTHRAGFNIDVRQDIADYYAHVTALDEQVGRIVDYLVDQRMLEETLVVYTSDHGTMLGSHGMVAKQVPYEESIGIPLVMRLPTGRSRPRVSSLPIGVIDVAPTLLGLLGVPVPAEMQGDDLSAEILNGEPAGGAVDRPVYLSEATGADQARWFDVKPWRGLRDRRWTYARDLTGPWLLFDNDNDPWQLDNLVDSPDHGSVVSTLDEQLQELISAAEDPLGPVDVLFGGGELADQWALRENYHDAALAELRQAWATPDGYDRVRRSLGW